MASIPTRNLDKFKTLFRRKGPESSSNIEATSPSLALSSSSIAPTVPNAPNTPLPPVTLQKAFIKSKNLEKDIAILSATYILDENPELKRLIHMIVLIYDRDEEGQLTDILETSAQFSMQLASAAEAHRTEATQAITTFIKTIDKINTVQLEGNYRPLDALKSTANDDIAKIKVSHPFMRNYETESSERLSKVLGVAIGASISILQVIKEASGLAPVPWVKPLIGGVVTLLMAVAQTRSNYSDMKEIAATAGEFAISCAVICSDRALEPSNELKRSLNIFTKKLENIVKECDKLSKMNPFWRYLQQNSQSDDLKAIRERLRVAIEIFQNESHINIILDIKDLSRKIDYTTLNNLPSHPYYKPNEYLHASRDDTIQYVSGWIDEPNEFALWVHGAAGLGKSTLSQQLVNLLKSDDRLAGGVFLTNLTTEHPHKVIQMISKQLAEMHPLASANIAKAARKLNGPHGALRDYFTSYIIDPVRTLKYSYQLIIVVDGLDEWTNREPFLAELEHIPSPSPVKFILTSRPNHLIERVLKKSPVKRYPLPPVSQETVERYFNYHFDSEKIDWRGRKPDERTISRLATQAHGLLIWAATVRSLVAYECDKRYPHVILDQILSSEEKVGNRNGEQLERLYHGAIAALFPETEMREWLQYFLGGMTVLQGTLPIQDFAKLINIPDRPAEEIQRRLVALQTRGNPTIDILPAIQQFHFSFLEFIQPISEHSGKSIAISSMNSHYLVANQCLKIVFSELLSSYRGQSCTYSELRDSERYAVKFWPLHVTNGSPRAFAALSATSLYSSLLDISDAAMQRWGTLFLPSVSTRFQDKCGRLDVPSMELPYKLAMIIGKDDMSTLLYRIHCLEIAVRLQPIAVEIWQDLGESYHMQYEYGMYNKDLEEEINVFRQALELISQKTRAKGSLDDVDVIRGTKITECESITLIWLGKALRTRFEQWGTSNDVDESVSLLREALALRPTSHPDRSASLNNLARSLLIRFEQQGTSNDLDEAIFLNQEALALQPAPHPDRSVSLNNLASSLLTRFEQQGTSNDLDEAIPLHREALALRPAIHPHRSCSLNNIASSLHARFKQQGASNDLDEAIFLHQEALALQPEPHPDRSATLNNLASSLFARFEQQGASNDLDEVILLHREALCLRPMSHPHRSRSLNDLATSLQTRFEQQGTSNDLDEAISLHREALALRPTSHPNRSSSLNNLANSLLIRFGQQATSNDLDEAIFLHREALALQPAPHPDRSASLNNLASSLHTRFEQQGASNDLDEAIFLHQEALSLQPEPHPYRSALLNNLASSLFTRFEQQGASNDLDEAILLDREALSLRPMSHPHRSCSLNNLASSLFTRFEQQGASNELDEAISLHREALALRPAIHPQRSCSLNNLAISLKTRFEQQGTSNDLDEVILLHREALSLRPMSHPHRSCSLNNLASSLFTRFEQQGASNDLDEAIFLHREALALQPMAMSHLDRSLSLNNLASSLLAHFEQQGTSNDLDEAISLHREALALQPATHPNHYGSLNHLASSLLTRFEQQGTSNDLDEAISLHREALALQPEIHPDCYCSLDNLASSLLTRFERHGTSNDLDEAIFLCRELLALQPAPHSDRYRSLNNLAVSLESRFEQQGTSNDLDEAILLHREALALQPAPHPDRSSSLNRLASSLRTRFKQQGTSNDLDEAISLDREALAL